MRNRLHALCPYFTMFPESFVAEHAQKYSQPGDLILDPFSGRGTTLLQSLLMNRQAAAIDVNPVAYCITGAKANVPEARKLRRRIEHLEGIYVESDHSLLKKARAALPGFFRKAFHRETLAQLLFLRSHLRWRRSYIDRFLAAVILGILHGESDRSNRYLSNQMPRTISPKPAYCMRWWRKRKLRPENRDVFLRLREEITYRLGTSPAPDNTGTVVLGDARAAARLLRELEKQVACVITSPPYYDVSSAEEDQWLRLWFLGHHSHPTYRVLSKDDRYEVEEKYWAFLEDVWGGIAPLLQDDAVIVCRLGGSKLGEHEITQGISSSLQAAFPKARMLTKPRESEIRRRQTHSFRPGTSGYRSEIDYVFAVG